MPTIISTIPANTNILTCFWSLTKAWEVGEEAGVADLKIPATLPIFMEGEDAEIFEELDFGEIVVLGVVIGVGFVDEVDVVSWELWLPTILTLVSLLHETEGLEAEESYFPTLNI